MTLINPPDTAAVSGDASLDVVELAAWVDRALTQPATDATSLYRAAMTLWQAYEYERAWRAFELLMARGELDAGQMAQVARRCFIAGRFGVAAAVMDKARRLRPNDVDLLAMLAACLERDNEIDTARTVLDEALSLNPHHVRSVRLLAHLERRAGAFDAAMQRLRDQLSRETTPDDWRLRYELAAVLDRVGSYDEAFTELERAKAQLQPRIVAPLKQSFDVRRRQRELIESITRNDLTQWRSRTAGLPQQRITFMAGFPRSGTTLLEQMLAAHPECIGTDESGVLRTQFLEPIVYQARTTREAIDELRTFDEDAIEAGREVYLRCTTSCLGEPIGSRMLIEKDPLLTADLALATALFPEAQLLMPLRDPRDVVISYCFTMVPLNWMSAPAVSVAQACVFYADVMRHWLHWRDVLAQPGVAVRYEDVIADPRHEVERLCDALGLPWDDAVLDTDKRSATRAVRTPTYDDVSRPLYSRSIGRWRHYEKHLAPAMSVLEPYLDAFGYA